MSSSDSPSASEIVDDYVRSMRQLKTQAAAASNAISGAQFDEYVLKRFFPIQYERDRQNAAISDPVAKAKIHWFSQRHLPKLRNALIVIVLTVCIAVMLLVLIGPFSFAAMRQHLGGLFMLHIQPLIHPGMSLWRTITLPLLSIFPSLSVLYDESCLLSNPFFHIAGMDCRPCAGVHSVLDYSGRISIAVDEPRPQVYHFKEEATDAEMAVNVDRFYDLFRNHTDVFRSDAYDVRSTQAAVTNLDELFVAFGLGENLENRTDGL